MVSISKLLKPGSSTEEILVSIVVTLPVSSTKCTGFLTKAFKTNPVDQITLDRTLVKLRSDFYNTLGTMFGFGKADLLASFALFDDDPSMINDIENQFKAVTPELIQKTAQEYLRQTNRTVLTINPNAKS